MAILRLTSGTRIVNKVKPVVIDSFENVKDSNWSEVGKDFEDNMRILKSELDCSDRVLLKLSEAVHFQQLKYANDQHRLKCGKRVPSST